MMAADRPNLSVRDGRIPGFASTRQEMRNHGTPPRKEAPGWPMGGFAPKQFRVGSVSEGCRCPSWT